MTPSLANFYTYRDVVVAQRDGDLGDAPQRTAFYHVGKAMLDDPEPFHLVGALQILRGPDGALIRDPIKWNDPADISRDQFDPVVVALGFYCIDWKLKHLVFAHWRRCGLYPNGDLASPMSITMELRALRWFWFWPFFWIGDLFLLLGAIISCVQTRRDANDVDLDNAVVRLAQAEMFYPTPLSWLARKVFVWFYPKNNGRLIYPTCDMPMLQAIGWKHRAAALANPAFFQLWKPTVERWYGR